MNSDPLSMLMARGPRGGRPAVQVDDVPARHDVAGGELLEHHARDRPDIEGVELDQIAGRPNRPVGRPPDGVRA